jgi:aminoglycoside 3-N-acetyltransferase
MTKELFIGENGNVTNSSLLDSLRSVNADECDLLYVHSALTFGKVANNMKRIEVLEETYSTLLKLKVPTICFPTYTFSFCNNQNFNVGSSKSQMGALNEYARTSENSVRSRDPLMSVAVVGQNKQLVANVSNSSIGTDSTFDRIRKLPNVKFLFLGVDLGACFTYMHYLEWEANVPYRYDRCFSGDVIAGETVSRIDQELFVRFKNVKPNLASYDYQNLLAQSNFSRTANVGDSIVNCVDEVSAREVYLELLYKDPNYFIEGEFDPEKSDRSFEVKNMIAL